MAQGRVIILEETIKNYGENDWKLCFQYCLYDYGDGQKDWGYRFIWRRPDGSLQGARGQARLPSLKDIQELIENAIREGWGQHIH
jgi:hypothetical protein